MNHGQRDAWGGGTMFERRGRVAKAYPNPAHPMQQSRSAHLLSIRLEQHGLRSTPRRTSTWSSRNVVVFLSCRSTTSSDSEKLFVVPCAIASSRVLRRAFARWTECALGNRGKRVIWEKSQHFPRFTPPRSGPCLLQTLSLEFDTRNFLHLPGSTPTP